MLLNRCNYDEIAMQFKNNSKYVKNNLRMIKICISFAVWVKFHK